MILKESRKEVTIYFHTGEVKNLLLFREDRVTGNVSVINHSRALRPHSIKQHSQLEVAKEIKKTEKSCIFCKYEEHEVPLASKEKRYKKGEAVIFQNLYPFAAKHYVGILTSKHFVNSFKVKHFRDVFLLFKELIKNELSNEYFYINMNFLPPAGASIMHPHVQAFASQHPTPKHHIIIRGFKKYSKDAWVQDHERKGLIVAKGKYFTILATFAPVLNYEIAFISYKNNRLVDMSNEEITELSKIITKVVNSYLNINPFNAFNFAIYEHEQHGVLGFIGLRKSLNKYYSSDRGFLESYHGMQVISVYPENVAKEITKKFNR